MAQALRQMSLPDYFAKEKDLVLCFEFHACLLRYYAQTIYPSVFLFHCDQEFPVYFFDLDLPHEKQKSDFPLINLP